MAELTCPHCEREYAGDQVYCAQDFTPLVPVAGPPVGAPGAPGAPDARGLRRRAAAAPVSCPDPDCGGVPDPGAGECEYCGTPLPAPAPAGGALRLRGPWGEIELGADPLVIGRASPVPRVADALAPLDIVSRRHAELVRADGLVWLADAGSANGTFLNDARLEPGTPVVVRPGDTIRLGSSVHLGLGTENGADA